MSDLDNVDIVKYLNETSGGWAHAMGLRFISASADEISCEWTVGPEHLQPFGIVHGGVHAGVVETLCSLGASIASRLRGNSGSVVGLENRTSFIRAVGAGTVLTGRAVPVTRGRTTHVWDAKITDSGNRLIAQGSVRLLCIAEGTIPKPSGT